jgi:hypothetical protein
MSSRVVDLTASGALTGTELFYADNLSTPLGVKVTTNQIRTLTPFFITTPPWTIPNSRTYVAIQNSTGAPISINLPAVSGSAQVTIKDASGNFGTYIATIVPNGVEVIDGAANFIMLADWGAVTFTPIAGGWLTSGW